MPHIEISQVVFFVASCITLAALYSQDMLILQSLYLVSSLLFLGSSIAFKIPVMIFFNISYVLVNITQIVKILIARSAILLPHHLKKLYKDSFSTMTPREFLAFIKLGVIETVNSNEFLCRDGDLKEYLLLLLEGNVSVAKNSQLIAKLDGFHFIGEMRYLTRKAMTADVKTEGNVTCIKWSFDTLNALKIKKPDTYTKFLETMANDLVLKIANRQIVLQ